MNRTVRGAYLGTHFAMVGPVIACMFMSNLVPALIWLAASAAVLACAREIP